MAGRPTTGGSTTGLLVGMCVSIGVAVIGLVMLVVLWTNQEELRQQAQAAQDESNRVMKSGERSGTLRTWMDKATGGRSVAGLMAEELTRFSELIAGDQTPVQPGSVDLIEGRLEGLWEQIGRDESIADPGQVVDQPLVEALAALYALYTAQRDGKEAAEREVTDLNSQIAALAAENQAVAAQFDESSAQLGLQVASIESDREAFYENKAQEFRDLEESALAKSEDERRQREQLEAHLQEERDKLAKSEKARGQMQAKLREFQILPKQGGSARHADGEIITATPGADIVFVDLGRQDNLILGMRFAVYPSEGVLPRTGQAKAAVEVVDIRDAVTVCRIVWVDSMNPILRGDVIANPIYDRERQLVFKVIGRFDLDYDGSDDPYGQETIEAVIKEFNGTVTSDLTARVDFVIVGARPLPPRLPRNADEAKVIKEEFQERADEYQQVFEDAKALSVPMLTQETFLNFLGRR